MFFRQIKPSDLSRGKPVKTGVRTHKIEEKDKHGNKIVSAVKGRKALLGFVPCLELLVKAFNVVLCLDHDAAGIEANEKISDSLAEKGHYAVGRALPKYKDWNEDLKARHGIEPLPAEEHSGQLLRNEICSEVSALCHEKKNADRSATALQNLFKNFRVHRHWGRFDEANGCLRDLLTRSLLAAAKEYRQMEHIRDLGTVQSRCGHIQQHKYVSCRAG